MTHEEPVQLGRYKILGELGRGAMGAVYLAEDPALKRGIAIKVVPGGVNRDEALMRFQREAESAARLHHPNIVSVFDVGEDPQFGPYLAMEYVEGESLHDRISRGPLPPTELADLMLQGMQALETAHRAGILHRDVKPGNFMLSKDGSLKLMDFGIARSTELLQTTGLLCTPAYASPELLQGLQPTASDDRWAFVVTVFHSLTGRVPFEGTSIAGTIAAIANALPVLPADMDPKMAEVFRKAFAKDPAHRYPELRSFLKDLLAALPLDDHTRSRIQAQHGLQDIDSMETRPVLPLQRPAPPARPLPWKPFAVGAALVLAGALVFWLRAPVKRRPLSVVSVPAGAEVRVDGDLLGRTPIAEGLIAEKAEEVELKLDGYQPAVRPIGPKDKRISVQLVALPWEVDLRTSPPGAEVRLNGTVKGTTPIQDLEVPGDGTHRLELRMAGYRRWAMMVSKNRRPPEDVTLVPLPKDSNRWKQFEQKFKDWFGS